MALIRIGDAGSGIPKEGSRPLRAVPWRQIMAMRHLAAHHDDDLDPPRVWRTVTTDVPGLRRYLAEAVIPGLDQEASRQPRDPYAVV